MQLAMVHGTYLVHDKTPLLLQQRREPLDFKLRRGKSLSVTLTGTVATTDTWLVEVRVDARGDFGLVREVSPFARLPRA